MKVFLKKEIQSPSESLSSDNIENQLSAAKKARTVNVSEYIQLDWIPPDSNMVERLFSKMKLVFSSRRQSMYPRTLQNVMMLTCNRDLWNMDTVNDVYYDIQNGPINIEDEESDEEDEE